jgi:hypothetical protein
MSFAIPIPLKVEHDHLHEHLRSAIAKGGDTGGAARRVAEVLHPHFVAEEQFALPPLGLLASLARSGGVKSWAVTTFLRLARPGCLHQEALHHQQATALAS